MPLGCQRRAGGENQAEAALVCATPMSHVPDDGGAVRTDDVYRILEEACGVWAGLLGGVFS